MTEVVKPLTAKMIFDVVRPYLGAVVSHRELAKDIEGLLSTPAVTSPPKGEEEPVALEVWYGKMPESNGRENWTALLRPKGLKGLDGFTKCAIFERSEYPERVRYEADRLRWIIGEIAERPDIMAYDPDLHSGYVEPTRPNPVSAELVEAADLRDAMTFVSGFRCSLGSAGDRFPADYSAELAEKLAAILNALRAALSAHAGGTV